MVSSSNFENKFDFDTAVQEKIILYAKWVENSTKETLSVVSILNKTNHIAFISGRTQNKMSPNSSMTRAEAATMLYRLFTKEALNLYKTTKNNFYDVDTNDWFNIQVSTLASAGILSGYEDGSFKSNKSITRAELATILIKFMNTQDTSIKNIFNDVTGHWASDYINRAANAGIISGYKDGTFKPDKNVTRAEAVSMINRLLGRRCDSGSLVTLSEYKTFTDVTPKDWFYYDIIEASNFHEYNNTNGNEVWTKLK